MSLEITFSSKNYHITKSIKESSLALSLGTLVVKNPRLVDGMGERIVHSALGPKMYSEIITLEWLDSQDVRREKTFSGCESYLLQSAIEDLESLQTGA